MFKVLLNNVRSRGAKFDIHVFHKHGAFLHYISCTVASKQISHLSLSASHFQVSQSETKAGNLSVFASPARLML